MYYYGYNSGYSYGSPGCGCSNYSAYPQYGYNNGNNGGAIILVLFILLVIVIGARLIND